MNVVGQDFHRLDEHAILCRGCEQNVLESFRNVSDKDFHAILRAPNKVILEAEYGPGDFCIPTGCSNRHHVISLLSAF